MARTQKTKNELLQDLVEEFRQQTGQSSICLKEVAAWMIRDKGWEPRKVDSIRVVAKELQIAMREQYLVDPQGRRVRQKHPQRIKIELKDGSHEQLVLWHDIKEASRPQMQAAFQQRRFGIALDCRRLKIDADSYNENYNQSVPIQLEFDFADDLADFEHDDDHESSTEWL